MRINLAMLPNRPGFGINQTQHASYKQQPSAATQGAPKLALMPDVGQTFVRFGTAALSRVRFVSPMVVENVPDFDANNPQVVTIYKDLMAQAQAFAKPDVSGRKVGAVVIGDSGRAYLGANIEVKGSAFYVVHAEAFALTLARQNGEKGLKLLFQSLQPCGPCRQIVREAGNEQLPLHIVDGKDSSIKTMTIGELFPYGYSYANPGMNMFKPPVLSFQLHPDQKKLSPLAQKAFQSALESYLPNPRKTWSGMVVQMKDGKEYQGSCINVSGPNPTMMPVQDIMVKIVADGRSLNDIAKAVLVEPMDPDYASVSHTKDILKKIAPRASFSYVPVKTNP